MWEESKTQNNVDVSCLMRDVFKNNWQANFVWNAANDTKLTYQEFFTEAKLYSQALCQLGLTAGQAIMLMLDNSLDLMILYFAGLLAGLRVIPVDPLKGIGSINALLAQVECKLVISDVEKNNLAVKNFINIHDFKKFIPPHYDVSIKDLDIFKAVDYEQAFLIAFTSGSTGMPKGVIHSFGNLIRSALSFGQRFGFKHDNIFYHNLPMTYMAGILNQIFLPFVFGSQIVIGERFNIAAIPYFWQYPVKYKVNTFWFTPTIITLLLKLDRGKIGNDYAAAQNKIIGCVGTAPLIYSLKQKFEDKYQGIKLYESYGLSETLFIAAECPGEDSNDGVGRVLTGAVVDIGHDQELLLSSGWNFLGYVGGVGPLSIRKFPSGDLGYFDRARRLHITGRKKDLIIRGGINISPRELENVINGFDFFPDHVILGMEDDVLGEKIVCFYVEDVEKYKQIDKKEVNRKIIAELGQDRKIDEFFRLAEMPCNLNGKVDKLKIKYLYQNR